MKKLFTTLFIFIIIIFTANAVDMTNGVFYANSPVECHLIAQDSSSVSTHLIYNRTYMSGNVVAEMKVTNVTDFYLAGVGLIEAGTNSVFRLNLFTQEVENLTDNFGRAQFGICNVNVMLNSGDFVIIYHGGTNSSFTVSTPLTSYDLISGKYFVRVTNKSTVVYVMEGTLIVHSDGSIRENTGRGKCAWSIQNDPSNGISDRIVSNIEDVSSENSERFNGVVVLAEKKLNDGQFVIINGSVVGIH